MQSKAGASLMVLGMEVDSNYWTSMETLDEPGIFAIGANINHPGWPYEQAIEGA